MTSLAAASLCMTQLLVTACVSLIDPHRAKRSGVSDRAWGHAGQGVNQGFEDACELAHYLDQGGLQADSLRQFEASRIPRVQEVMAAEMVSIPWAMLLHRSI